MTQPAGWYTNPDGTASQRFWDGNHWTHDVRPVPGSPAAGAAVTGATELTGTDPTSAVGGLLSGQDPSAEVGLTSGPDPAPSPSPSVGIDPPIGGQAEVDHTVTVAGAPTAGPGAGPGLGVGPAAGPAASALPVPPSGSDGGSIGDLFGLLFDLGLQRSFSAGTARLGYLIGVVAIGVVSILMLIGGLQGGGTAAVLSIVLFPLLALLWLISFRALMQLVRDRAAEAAGRQGDPGS